MGSGNLSSLLGEWPCKGLECARPCVTNPRRMKVNTRLEFRGNEHVRAPTEGRKGRASRPSDSRFTDRPTHLHRRGSDGSPRSPPVFDFSSCIVVQDISESPPDNKGSLLLGKIRARTNGRPLFEGMLRDFLTSPARNEEITSLRRNGDSSRNNNFLRLLDKN